MDEEVAELRRMVNALTQRVARLEGIDADREQRDQEDAEFWAKAAAQPQAA